MKYVMGIDQGASKTLVIIGNEYGQVLGFGKSYGACHTNTGIEYAMNAVKEAMEYALEQAGIKLEDITALAAGMTGVDWEYEGQLLKEGLKNITGIKKVFVVNDCIIAMRAGTNQNYGAVLCAGSGLNCAVRDKEGKEFVYGFYIDEEYQGGSALGKACMRSVIDAQVGLEEKTLLTQMLLKKFECKNVDQLLYKKVTGEITQQDYLSLPMVLEEAARLGDKAAKDILYRFGWQWGRFVSAAIKNMGMLEKEIDVVLSGSIFKCREPELKKGVIDQLAQDAPLAKIVDATFEPVVGAFLLALENISEEIENCISNIESSSENFPLKRAME